MCTLRGTQRAQRSAANRQRTMEAACTADLPLRMKASLEKAGLTHQSILTMTFADLRRLADLTEDDIQVIKTCSSSLLMANKFHPACASQWKFLTMGCALLDGLLGGGFARWGITEVAGESGTGKTQLCLQATLCAQLPLAAGGTDAGAVYICTEDPFPSARLQQLIEKWPCTHTNVPAPATNFADNIFIEHVPDLEALKNCVCVRLPVLLRQKRIGLVVIDSIAGPFRADYELSHGAVVRAQSLRAISQQLQLLAQAHCLAVLCVNQVTTVPGEGSSTVVPALGLAWANLVTTRLQLHRTGNRVAHPTVPSKAVAERKLQVVFCPYLETRGRLFVVTECGIQGLNKPVI